jgi:glutamate racemase
MFAMIGVFDSGIGGLTVVQALKQRLADYDIVYFGDTARSPYGTKSPQTVTAYALEGIEFLLNQGAGVIVVACNSASSVAIEPIMQRSRVPVMESITPATAMAVESSTNLRIGIIGTRTTVASGEYEKKIQALGANIKVISAACPLLVPLVEEWWLKKPETNRIVKKYLHPLKVRQIDTLILGCTHYSLLKKTIQMKIGRRVNIIDSAAAVAENLKDYLQAHGQIAASLSKKGRMRLFVSDLTDQIENSAKMILKRNVRLEAFKALPVCFHR